MLRGDENGKQFRLSLQPYHGVIFPGSLGKGCVICTKRADRYEPASGLIRPRGITQIVVERILPAEEGNCERRVGRICRRVTHRANFYLAQEELNSGKHLREYPILAGRPGGARWEHPPVRILSEEANVYKGDCQI
jgi:hypothetical protein